MRNIYYIDLKKFNFGFNSFTKNILIYNNKFSSYNFEVYSNDFSGKTLSEKSSNYEFFPSLFYSGFFKLSLLKNRFWGIFSPFSKVLIFRGIGYRANFIQNNYDQTDYHYIDFPFMSYLVVKAGHSFNLYKPIPKNIGIYITKKERKLVIYGTNKDLVNNFASSIFKLRPPSVYTGRGIRMKKVIVRRKLGKKDVRKGRFF